MNYITTNWRTSLAGIVVFALYGLQTIGVNVPGVHVDGSTLAVAFGLLLAKDSNVSGGTTKQ